MELRENLGGNLYLFAGGTGILPFLDLIDFLLKKAIFLVASRKNQKLANPFNEEYNKYFDPNLKVKLFGSFTGMEDFTGFDFIKKLCQISKEENLGLFEAVIRINKPGGDLGNISRTSSYFNEMFIKENVDFEAPSRFYVCGSPQMNLMVLNALSNLKVSEGKIFIV